MSNLITHARNEFRAAKWINDNGEYCDEMQGMICDHVLKLLEVFSNEGHSGSSAPYAVNVFQKLAMYEPLVPLTGEDWEWTLLDYGVDPKWQNKRCGRVFKDADGIAYDIDGIVFYDWYEDENHERHKSHYTCRESRVPVTFPYTPTTVYKERETPEQMGS
jgi:hypothetical protein